jgi:phage baseplate assembly protein gpV
MSFLDTTNAPTAAAVVAAFNAVMDVDDPQLALAVALRELVKVQGAATRGGGIILSGHDILAIADNIEQAITYAENQSNGN